MRRHRHFHRDGLRVRLLHRLDRTEEALLYAEKLWASDRATVPFVVLVNELAAAGSYRELDRTCRRAWALTSSPDVARDCSRHGYDPTSVK